MKNAILFVLVCIASFGLVFTLQNLGKRQQDILAKPLAPFQAELKSPQISSEENCRLGLRAMQDKDHALAISHFSE